MASSAPESHWIRRLTLPMLLGLCRESNVVESVVLCVSKDCCSLPICDASRLRDLFPKTSLTTGGSSNSRWRLCAGQHRLSLLTAHALNVLRSITFAKKPVPRLMTMRSSWPVKMRITEYVDGMGSRSFASEMPRALNEWSRKLASELMAFKYWQFEFFQQWEQSEELLPAARHPFHGRHPDLCCAR